MRSRFISALWVAALVTSLTLVAGPAGADHTNPNTPQSPLAPALPGTDALAMGEGTWEFIENFPPNPGTDLQFFQKNGDLYASSGTLGQFDQLHVGQRITKLVEGDTGAVDPTWVADHGSAHCTIQNQGVTGLQHDAEVTPQVEPTLLIDTTDTAMGRCHDPGGGGLEIIDISGLGQPGFEVREIHLTRHRGLSHTASTDPTHPGIIYNSTSDSNTPNLWIDIVDARSCFRGGTLAQKRDLCRPRVYRLSWESNPDWTRRDPDGEEGPRPNEVGSESACHDITVVGDTLYCASLNATIIFDISGVFLEGPGGQFKISGKPISCPVIDGTRTAAKVTDCSGVGPSTPASPVPHVRGWTFLGNYNHPGRPPNQQNNNLEVPSNQGVSVSHESDPTPDNSMLLVTDERGGGVVPPGASCAPGIDNPFGNGGISFLDLTQRAPDLNGGPGYLPYERMTGGAKAIFRGNIIVPAPTFCDVHVLQHVADEARVVMAYYSQGIKILDYFVDDKGVITFQETASLTLPGANNWTAEHFRVVDNPDGTRTYFIMVSDIQRGIDVVSWTGPTNPLDADGSAPAPSAALTGASTRADAALLGLAILGLPAAALFGRRRRRRV